MAPLSFKSWYNRWTYFLFKQLPVQHGGVSTSGVGYDEESYHTYMHRTPHCPMYGVQHCTVCIDNDTFMVYGTLLVL